MSFGEPGMGVAEARQMRARVTGPPDRFNRGLARCRECGRAVERQRADSPLRDPLFNHADGCRLAGLDRAWHRWWARQMAEIDRQEMASHVAAEAHRRAAGVTDQTRDYQAAMRRLALGQRGESGNG